nr:PREDICTED: RIIa domain-containing protein 1 isoform X1 [Rhinolophus sinicus]
MATLEGGLLGSDPGALSLAQLEQLRDFKIQTRIANEKYLRTHKEVDLLISGFFREMFLQRPDNIREFAADRSSFALVRVSVGCPGCEGKHAEKLQRSVVRASDFPTLFWGIRDCEERPGVCLACPWQEETSVFLICRTTWKEEALLSSAWLAKLPWAVSAPAKAFKDTH